MRRPIFILALLLLIPAVSLVWQIGNAELDNVELHDDLLDVAAQNGVNIGLNSPKTDDQVRQEVCDTAAEHGLKLRPDQIKLQRFQTGLSVRFDLAVDYTVPIKLLLFSFNLRFVQMSARKKTRVLPEPGLLWFANAANL